MSGAAVSGESDSKVAKRAKCSERWDVPSKAERCSHDQVSI